MTTNVKKENGKAIFVNYYLKLTGKPYTPGALFDESFLDKIYDAANEDGLKNEDFSFCLTATECYGEKPGREKPYYFVYCLMA